MEFPRTVAVFSLMFSVAWAAGECEVDGVVRQSRDAFLSPTCNKAFMCYNGNVNVIAEVWRCPQNAHCDAGVCKCDDKFEPSKYNTVGWIETCARVVFTCDYEGVSHEKDTTWLTDDCTQKILCHEGTLIFNRDYTCQPYSHCNNNECVCDENYSMVYAEPRPYCERSNFDCDHEGTKIEDRTHTMTSDCSKLLECFNGRLTVTEWSCADNMHCTNASCQCDAKYRPSSLRSDGLILGCLRYDYSCDQDGITRDEATKWMNEDCTKSYLCSRGVITEEEYQCPELSHCQNRVCFCDEGFKVRGMWSSGLLMSCMRKQYDVNCTAYFYEQFGLCLRDRAGERDYAQSLEYCENRAGILMVPDRLSLRFKQLSTIVNYQERRFYLAGSSIFNDISALPLTKETLKDREFIASMIQAHNVPEAQQVLAFRRFSATATVSDLNYVSPLSSLCLSYDFTTANFGPALIDCHEKINAICQKEADVVEKPTELTEWFDVDKTTDAGNTESLTAIIDAYGKGTLPPDAKVCRSPLAIECREIGTDKIYSAANTHGFVLRKACESLTIECANEDQANGAKCPDFEIRFKCNVDPTSDCAVDATRTNCESNGKECVMKLYGAICLTRRSKRTGYEKIGVDHCTLNSIKYSVHTCSVQGPRFTTFDSEKYDYHGKCSYTLASTKDDYRPTSTFPAFSVVLNNVVDPDGYDHTVAFDLTISSITYSFIGDTFFINTGTTVQVNPIGYTDNHIAITAQSAGSYVKYTIETSFCLTINFDNEHGLQVRLPSSYVIRIVGMCGNFDSNDKNDVRLPSERETTTPDILGDYFLVSSTVNNGKCMEGTVAPQNCDQSAINLYTGPDYCGVFDSTRASPLVSSILDLSQDYSKDYNRRQLNKLYQDCIKANCNNQSVAYRCRSLDETIDRLALNMNLDEPDFESQWRDYVRCENVTSSMCDDIPNTVFQEKYKPNCQDSCFVKDRSAQCGDEVEKPGCACNPGFYLDARLKCVSAAECEKTCRVDVESGESMELNNGDTFVSRPCASSVMCVDGEAVDVTIGPCSEYAECVDFGRQCSCRQGFVGDGITCTSEKTCREGYQAIGNKCYKFVLSKIDWHTAAISCGVDGSQLARYDSPIDIDLQLFIHKVPLLYLQSLATRIRRKCYSGSRCIPARKAYITSVDIAYEADKADCVDNYHISEDKKFVVVTGNCKARFIIGYVDYTFAKNLKVEDFDIWIGGNTHVIGEWNQNGKSHYQVDPPKLVDPGSFDNEMGCYQASINSLGEIVVKPIPDCDQLKVSLCEYDNTKDNQYDPNDYKGINQEVIYQKAIELCEAENRPLATIINKNQLDKVRAIISTLGGAGWIGGRYTDEAGQFLWPGNQALLFDNWDTSEPDNLKKKDTGTTSIFEHCLSMEKRTGKWKTSECSRKFFPICGPPDGNKPTVYTSYFPVSKPSNLTELKETIQKSGIKDYICMQPISMECTARELANSQWLTNDKDTTGSMQCDMNAFSCAADGTLDCSTFQVRFLCPTDENNCQSLKDLGVTPCDAQRTCIPVRNHYACRCPAGKKWNKYSKECTKPCGECHARGDPHYITLGGQNYDFQGQCKYKFSGICENDRNQSSPSFDVYTQNAACGSRGASCLKSIEIKLFNMPINRDGVVEKVDYVIFVPATSSDYKVNGVTLKQNQHAVPPAFSLVRRRNYFYFESPILDITVLFSGFSIKLTIPDKFHDKMCGLCGQCGSTDLKMKDGTIVTPEANSRGRIKSEEILAFANDWLEVDPTLNMTECEAVVIEDCPDAKIEELSQPDKCGIFLNPNSNLKDCYDVVDPTVYFDDCKFDACLENPVEAICRMISSYAQACSQKDISLDWRRPDFCPYTCTDGKEYQSDASCAPTCGQGTASRELCDEDPEEGCVCPRGKMRLGDQCVDPDKCGCLLLLDDGAQEWLLHPDESILKPECREKVKCEINEDGVAITVSEQFSLDANAICVPGIPPTIECRKGYTLAADGVTCTEDPDACTGDYEEVSEMCVDPQPEERIWRQAIVICNENDGTLVKVKDNVKLEELGKLMQENDFDSVFISGQVKAVKDESNKITFTPVLDANQQDKIEFYNFDFKTFLLPLISLTSDVEKSSVNTGDVFALVLSREDDGSLLVTAVPRDTKANFICEERKPKDNETEWTKPCNSDSNMADDGDRETKSSLIMVPECLVCAKPKDVRCEAINATIGSVNGTCQITSSGTYYYCDQGSNCIDNSVSLKCPTDTNECDKELDDCTDRMVCVNTIGAYKCICKENYPNMVDGKCESRLTCTMAGPETPSGYVYDFKTFFNKSLLFDYDCPFQMATVCENYDGSVPFVAVYVMSNRKAGALQTRFAGVIFDPVTQDAIVWSANAENLAEATIQIGPDLESMMEAVVGFTAQTVQTQFNYLYPNGVIIRHINNYFKIIVSLPNKIQVTFSEEYRDILCGLCTMEASQNGGSITLTPDQDEEISIPHARSCAKKGDNTTVTTPSPSVTSIITTGAPATTRVVPPTAGPNGAIDPLCDLDLIELCHFLSLLCPVTKLECATILCSGTTAVCDYLKDGDFDLCKIDNSMTTFTDSLDSCDEGCASNMRFQYSRKYNQPSCSLPNGITDESFNNDYGFTCTCDDGYILSGNKCIRNQNCGCTLGDGYYKERGDVWRTENCTKIHTCLGDNKKSIEIQSCGPNTECLLNADGYVCKCLEKFIGDPDAVGGCKPVTEVDDGNKTCTTFVTDAGAVKTECTCNMGFRSNCETCEDINECKEKLHDCHLKDEKCVNKLGSYECDCAEGFTAKNGGCVDVNECDTKAANCTDKEGCINMIGSYRCDCCVGYLHNPETEACEKDEFVFAILPKDVPCCVDCPNPVLCDESINNPVPYCYITKEGYGHQYPSFKAMYEDFCINNYYLNKSQVVRGPCPNNTKAYPTEDPTPTGESPFGPLPKSCDDPALCQAFPPPPPVLQEGSVCGPSNVDEPKTYPSYCDMLRAVCKGVGGPSNVPRQSPIDAKKGPCSTGPGGGGGGTGPPVVVVPSDPLFTSWSPFSPCSPDDEESGCGQGEQIRDRDVVPYDDLRPLRVVLDYEIEERRTCFIPCDPNANPGFGLCPDVGICTANDPVCGYIGSQQAVTYNSECEMNVTACQLGKRPYKLNDGECDPETTDKNRRCAIDGPILKTEKFSSKKDNVHCVGQEVTLGKCKNLLCDGSLSNCCRPKDVETKTVTISCYDVVGDVYNLIKTETRQYYSAITCYCTSESGDN